MSKRPKSSGNRNDNRPNGKAFKKRKKKLRKTGRTIGGYSLAKIEIRKEKRLKPIETIVTES